MTIEVVRLASETDFPGWREAARSLRSRRIAPEAAIWTVDGMGGCLGGARDTIGGAGAFTVPRAFLQLADAVIRHRSDERFALLYGLLWRLACEPDLLSRQADPQVRKARAFAQAVAQAAQQMRAFADFRRFADAEGRDVHVAWFEPAHRVTEAAAPFFVRRFSRQRFGVLTPDLCAHWDAEALSFTPGVDPADAPRADGLEAYWRNLPPTRPVPRPSAPTEAETPPMALPAPTAPARRAPGD